MDRRSFIIGGIIPSTTGNAAFMPAAAPTPWRMGTQTVSGTTGNEAGTTEILDANGNRIGLFSYRGDGPQAFANLQAMLNAVNEKAVLLNDNERLRSALKPFAAYSARISGINLLPDACPLVAAPTATVGSPSVGDLRRAAQALADEQQAPTKPPLMNEQGQWYCDRCKEYYTPDMGTRDYRCPYCKR